MKHSPDELKQKADAGDSDAAFDYALSLFNGTGAEPDTGEALHYFMQAARTGDMHALSNVAAIRFNKDENDREAIRLFHRAARAGVKYAAYNLYIVYRNTHLRKALHYLKQAADAGYDAAEYELGVRTIAGHGVRRDEAAGLKLVEKAAAKKNADALFYLAEAKYHENPQLTFQRYRQAASQGHVKSMYELAKCLEYSHGTAPSPKLHLYWLKKAAQHGHIYAMCDFAANYIHRKNTAKNDEQYRYWMHRAAEHGDSLAMQNLGYYYWSEKRKASNTDIRKAIDWFTRAANAGQAQAWFCLGRIYGQGNEIEADREEAFRCYKRAVEGGYTAACGNLGLYYLYGIGTEANPQQAIRLLTQAVDEGYADVAIYLYEYCFVEEHADSHLYKKTSIKLLKKGAEMEHAESVFKLSLCYEIGSGVKKSPRMYYELSKKATELNHEVAPNNLGLHYELGKFVEQDYSKAAELYLRAAEAGDAIAQFNLACLYEKGKGVPKDEQQAFYWFKQSADNGDTNALLEVAVRYRDGKGTEQNAKQAFRYMKAAADDEFIPAYCELGALYKAGFGTRRNYKKAFSYLEKSHQCSFAMGHLGCMLLRGLGTARDIPRAVEYLKNAARQNEPHALYHLAECCENAWGVPKDTKKAARLYQKARALSPTGNALEKLCERI